MPRYTQLQCRIVPGSCEDRLRLMEGRHVELEDRRRRRRHRFVVVAVACHVAQLNSSECCGSLLEVLVAGQSIPFERLHIGLPVPSLQEDGVVYYLGKIDYRDSEQTACVVAVVMRNKTVRETAEFGAKMTVGLTVWAMAMFPVPSPDISELLLHACNLPVCNCICL